MVASQAPIGADKDILNQLDKSAEQIRLGFELLLKPDFVDLLKVINSERTTPEKQTFDCKYPPEFRVRKAFMYACLSGKCICVQN